jgi:hypothetical protein
LNALQQTVRPLPNCNLEHSGGSGNEGRPPRQRRRMLIKCCAQVTLGMLREQVNHRPPAQSTAKSAAMSGNPVE